MKIYNDIEQGLIVYSANIEDFWDAYSSRIIQTES